MQVPVQIECPGGRSAGREEGELVNGGEGDWDGCMIRAAIGIEGDIVLSGWIGGTIPTRTYTWRARLRAAAVSLDELYLPRRRPFGGGCIAISRCDLW